MSIGTDQNNPFDLEINPRFTWKGQIDSPNHFCKFDTIEHGLRAGLLDIWNAWKEGYNSPLKFAFHYAPPNENDSQSYADMIANFTGCEKTHVAWPISRDFLVRIAMGCLQMEQGHIGYSKRQLYQAATDAAPELAPVEGTDGYGNPVDNSDISAQ